MKMIDSAMKKHAVYVYYNNTKNDNNISRKLLEFPLNVI